MTRGPTDRQARHAREHRDADEPLSAPPGGRAPDEDIREAEEARAFWDAPETHALITMLERADAKGPPYSTNTLSWADVRDLQAQWPEIACFWADLDPEAAAACAAYRAQQEE